MRSKIQNGGGMISESFKGENPWAGQNRLMIFVLKEKRNTVVVLMGCTENDMHLR